MGKSYNHLIFGNAEKVADEADAWFLLNKYSLVSLYYLMLWHEEKAGVESPESKKMLIVDNTVPQRS